MTQASGPTAPIPDATAQALSADKPPSPAYRSYVLVMLLVIYVLNFVDRQILAILLEPIKADFAARGMPVTDAQMGLLHGFAFAIFYTVLGIPIAWAADRYNRAWIVTIALALWSAMTVACGLATNYLQLLLARVGVGVGEAGGSPPSQSMISDYFPPEQRASALGVWALGIPIGSAMGLILGAWVAKEYGWQMAFIVAGLPGILVAIVFRATVREPKRGRFDPPQAQVAGQAAKADLGQTLAYITSRPTFWLVAFGAALASFKTYALFGWGPSYFIRSFDLVDPTGLSTQEIIGREALLVSYFSAFVIGAAASLGTFFGGRLVDHFARKDARAYVTIPAIAVALSVPLNLAGFLAPSPLAAAAILLVPTLLGAAWYGPIFALVQNLVAPNMRAMATAILFFIINLIGLGGGPTVAGLLSEYFAQEAGPAMGLRNALLSVILVGLLAAALFWAARFTIRRDLASHAASQA